MRTSFNGGRSSRSVLRVSFRRGVQKGDRCDRRTSCFAEGRDGVERGRTLGGSGVHLGAQSPVAERVSRAGFGPDVAGMDRHTLWQRSDARPRLRTSTGSRWRAGLDHLRHGITATYNFSYGGHSRAQSEEFNEKEFRGEEDSGVRFVHGWQPGKAGPAYTTEMADGELEALLCLGDPSNRGRRSCFR